jgi:hypothetical protein
MFVCVYSPSVYIRPWVNNIASDFSICSYFFLLVSLNRIGNSRSHDPYHPYSNLNSHSSFGRDGKDRRDGVV